jgi:hypothetical protein
MPPAFFSTSNPLRYSRRQLKTWLALTVCRCATRATDAPGSNVSSTILRLSATERRRRGNALLTTTRSEVSIYPPMWTLTEVSTSGHRPHLPPLRPDGLYKTLTKNITDSENQNRILRFESLRSWATILVPFLSIVRLAVTIGMQYAQLISAAREANSDLQPLGWPVPRPV